MQALSSLMGIECREKLLSPKKEIAKYYGINYVTLRLMFLD
jgi:hypothetical protein